jgi:TonB family protein
MRAPRELWEKWEGRIIDGKFPLRQWLGGCEHSSVFLTERGAEQSQKAAIKLIPAEDLDEDAQLSRWADAAKLYHPHLIRLFERGRCEIDGTRFLYVVTEYAEEDLAQILPLRALSAEEVSEMLPPIAEAMAFLHQAGFAHTRIKPSNVMAVENQVKISADGLRRNGEHGDASETSAYAAPEMATTGASPAADVWSLGVLLVAVLTQREPKSGNSDRGEVGVPDTIPDPFREIARECLPVDPRKRCTVGDILGKLKGPEPPAEKTPHEGVPEARTKRWMIAPVAIAVLILAALAGSRFIVRQPRVPPADNQTNESHAAPAEIPAAQSPAPLAATAAPTPTAGRGSVLQRVMPDVSRQAQNTITGRVKVNVRVAVDASGNVSEATFTSTATSKYFANLALASARRWKFNPPQVNGQATTSAWLLHFQFARTSTQVVPSEITR